MRDESQHFGQGHPNCPVHWAHLRKAQLLFAFMEIKLHNYRQTLEVLQVWLLSIIIRCFSGRYGLVSCGLTW